MTAASLPGGASARARASSDVSAGTLAPRNERRRVLYVDYSVGFGGAVKSLALTLRRLPDVDKYILTSQDDEIVRRWFPGMRVFSFRTLVNYRTKDRVAGRVSNPQLKRLTLKLFALADAAVTAANVVRIRWLITHQRIGLVHLNNGFTPPEAMIAARAANVPVVVHLRDFHSDPSRLQSAAARAVACVITVSASVGESLKGTPVDDTFRTTIHDPVDLEALRRSAPARQRVRAECALADADVAIGIFGRVISWKGQLDFVRAIIPILRDVARVRAIIVGDESDGTSEYIAEVRRAIASSGVASRFVLTGYKADVEDYYAAMDIVVHASTTPEPFGMVVPEAMASGRAVIAIDAGGPREVVTDGVDGLLVPAGDIDGLTNAMRRLVSDADLRARLSEAGARTASARFTIEASAAKIAGVYDAVVANEPARQAARSIASRSSR